MAGQRRDNLVGDGFDIEQHRSVRPCMDTIRSLGGRKRLQVRLMSTSPFLAHFDRCKLM